MNNGQLVPDNVLIAMFEEALVKPEYAKGFILDGFPRNLAQAKCLDELLEKLNCKLTVVINMQVDRSLLVERICGRRTCSNQKCSATYHIKFMPPNIDDVCDLCGSPLVRRSDDTEDVVQKRLEIYDRETAPLIEYYDNCLLLRTIDGDGDVDEIFADVLRTIKVLT